MKLISVPSADNLGRQAVAEHLLLAADGALTISPDTIARTVTRRITPPPSTPVQQPAEPTASPVPKTESAPAQAKPAGAIPNTPLRPTVVPRPVLPRPAAPVPAASASPPTTASASTHAAPAYSTSTGSVGGGVFGEPVLVGPEMIEQVAKSVYDVWVASATDEQIHALRAGRPNVPQDLDRILLIDLVNRSGISDIPTWARHSLRESFWHVVDGVDRPRS